MDDYIKEFIEYFTDPETMFEITFEQYIQSHSDLLQRNNFEDFQRIVKSTYDKITEIEQNSNEDTQKKLQSTDVNSIQKYKQLLQLIYNCQHYNCDFTDFYFSILDQYINNKNEHVVNIALQELALHISEDKNNQRFIQYYLSIQSTLKTSKSHQSILDIIERSISIDKTEETTISDIDLLYPYTARFIDVHREFRDSMVYFIDGDSLLLSIAYHINVDLISYYGNTLHTISIIERILLTLYKQANRYNYKVLFFDCHYQLYNQTNSILSLLRQCLITHLSKNTNIKIYQFSSWFNNDDYLKLTHEEKPMFIFYHDFSSFDINDNHLLSKDVLEKLAYTYYLFGNYHLYTIQCHLSLMNKLILTETSVQCFQLRFDKQIPQDKIKIHEKFSNILNENGHEFENFSQEIHQNDVRLCLYLKTIHSLMKRDEEENLWKRICPLLILHVSLLIRLALVDRHLPSNFPLIEFSLSFNESINKFQKELSLTIASCSSGLSWLKISDLFDGRLFAFTIYQIHQSTSNLHFDSETWEIMSKSLEMFKISSDENLFHDLIKQMIQSNDITIASTSIEQENEIRNKPKLTRISNSFIDKYLEPVISSSNQYLFEFVEPNDMQTTPYQGRHHWHNYKEVGDEISRIRNSSEESSKNPRFSETAKQKRANYFTLYGDSLITPAIKDTQLEIILPDVRNSLEINNEVSSVTTTEKKKIRRQQQQQQQNKGQTMRETINEKIEEEKEAKLIAEDRRIIDHVNKQLKGISSDNYFEIINCINNSLISLKTPTNRLKLLQEKLNIQHEYFKKRNIKKEESLRIDYYATLIEIVHLEKVQDPFTEMKKYMEEIIDYSPFDTEKWYRFQMEIINSRLPRRKQGLPDERLPGLIPDQWQIRFLDAIDQQQSIIIVAPTASGKTYASYYAMHTIVKENKYGTNAVCVYVAPTKALVNQVAATIQSKLGPVFGVFTRDFRENIDGCRILLTVPHCLQILLLSPQHQKWCQRIQYCIFDEIHCMSGEIGSEIWERTMLLINAPMIGLSATVNNGENLQNWIGDIEKQRSILFKTSKTREVCFIEYDERLADLNKYLYSKGELHSLHPIGLMDSKQLTTRGLPKDFSLSPRETLQLKDALDNKQIPTLTEYFSPNWIIERTQCNEYSRLILNQFQDLIKTNQNETIDSITNTLNPFRSNEFSYPEAKPISSLIVEFMLTLKEKNLLPCIVFSDNRLLCEQMAESVANYLIKSERDLRATKYKKQIDEIENRFEQIEKQQRKNKAKRTTDSPNRRHKNDEENEEDIKTQLSGHEQQLLSGILNECTLTNQRSYDQSRVDTFLEKASKDNPKLVEYMRRGIAFHYGNVNNKGRVAVEALFRERYVQLIFSTSTLAMGIHMPTKTVAFVRDSIYLDALQYRQTSGRAGRRGFDIQGHIVFIDIPIPKIRHLIVSSIPDIHPHFPSSVTFLMRLLQLCSNTENKYKQDAIHRSLIALQCPFMKQSINKQELIQIQLQYHCLYTLHFLHQLNLVNNQGDLVGLAGLPTHLHYFEPSNILFVYLMNNKLFHNLNDDIEIINILAHLFTNLPWLITHEKYEKLSSVRREQMFNSKLFLPSISNDIQQLINSYNSLVKNIYGCYIQNVIQQMRLQHNNQVSILPLSNVSFDLSSDYDNGTFEYNLHHHYSQQSIHSSISPFAGLSGLTHEKFMFNYNSSTNSWDLAYDLNLSPRIVPFIDISAHDHTNSAYYLNSYALDFYKHGSERLLITENQLASGDVYNLLWDFCLMIKSIETSIETIIKHENTQIADNEDLQFFQPLFDKFSRIRQNYFTKFYKQYPDRKAI
ncbi:hypothetical protein I4U23_016311 [Adineta vaga]|nr:hypothetical protein I4U23_016311 [Adineta vaga]